MSLLARPTINAVPSVAQMTITLYTREQCCCCQSAREVLQGYQAEHGFHYEEIDAADPALVDRIGPTIPVVAVDGKIRFRGEVNRALFERLLGARGNE